MLNCTILSTVFLLPTEKKDYNKFHFNYETVVKVQKNVQEYKRLNAHLT